jgi:hypothetical protein
VDNKGNRICIVAVTTKQVNILLVKIFRIAYFGMAATVIHLLFSTEEVLTSKIFSSIFSLFCILDPRDNSELRKWYRIEIK